MRTAEENAVEFGRHIKYGGWQLGLLVACSVERGSAGRPPGNRLDRDDSKISATEFARRSGTSNDRVLRFLHAWERAAEKRIVPKAEALSPGDADEWDLPEGYDWSDYYEGGFASPGSAGGILGRNLSAAGTPDEEEEAVDGFLDGLSAEAKRALEQGLQRDREEGGRPDRDREKVRAERAELERERSYAAALEIDAATDLLLRAASALASAEITRQRYGITNRAEEQKALRRVDHMRGVYGTDGKFTSKDREFLEEMGVEV